MIDHMIVIESTSFAMGSDDGEENERPIHRVFLAAFELAATQVTNDEYARFRQPPCWNDQNFNDPRQPVVAVSWLDAVAYCEWLSRISGRPFRLPTEAEWECAARGGIEGSRYPWGDDVPADRAMSGPDRVALQRPNAFGLYDMCTNVHEWCSDWYAAGYYSQSPSHNPRGPEAGTRRVSRGGSWRHRVKVTRCAARSSLPPEFQYTDYGFRVACDITMPRAPIA